MLLRYFAVTRHSEGLVERESYKCKPKRLIVAGAHYNVNGTTDVANALASSTSLRYSNVPFTVGGRNVTQVASPAKSPSMSVCLNPRATSTRYRAGPGERQDCD